MLSREEIRKKSEGYTRRFAIVTMANGEKNRICSINRAEQRKWRRTWRKKDGEIDEEKLEYSNDVILSMCWVDEEGNNHFTIKEALSGCFDNFDIGDTNTLIAAVTRHNNLDGEDDTAIGDAIKNSEETFGNDSSGVSAGDTE